MQLLHHLFIGILKWIRGTAQHTPKKRGCGHRENEDAYNLTRYLLPDASTRASYSNSGSLAPIISPLCLGKKGAYAVVCRTN